MPFSMQLGNSICSPPVPPILSLLPLKKAPWNSRWAQQLPPTPSGGQQTLRVVWDTSLAWHCSRGWIPKYSQLQHLAWCSSEQKVFSLDLRWYDQLRQKLKMAWVSIENSYVHDFNKTTASFYVCIRERMQSVGNVSIRKAKTQALN